MAVTDVQHHAPIVDLKPAHDLTGKQRPLDPSRRLLHQRPPTLPITRSTRP